MGQDVSQAPSISIWDHALQVVDHLPRSTAFNSLTLDPKLNKQIVKATTAFAKLRTEQGVIIVYTDRQCHHRHYVYSYVFLSKGRVRHL